MYVIDIKESYGEKVDREIKVASGSPVNVWETSLIPFV